jgi:hypothetical protein
MNEEFKTSEPLIGGLVGSTATKSPQPELERLAGIIADQRELISMLDGKLSMISVRNPETKQSDQDRPAHLSTLIDFVNDNNHELKRLVNELVI